MQIRYPLQIVGKLHNQETRFNLRHYRNNTLSVKMGEVVLGLRQDEFGLPEVSLEPQELGPDNLSLLDVITGLEPGSKVYIGRSKGVEIYNPANGIDHDRFRNLGGTALSEALRTVDSLSRQHAKITVLDPWTVSVRDLGSTNKTLVLAERRPREELIRELRSVQ